MLNIPAALRFHSTLKSQKIYRCALETNKQYIESHDNLSMYTKFCDPPDMPYSDQIDWNVWKEIYLNIFKQ